MSAKRGLGADPTPNLWAEAGKHLALKQKLLPRCRPRSANTQNVLVGFGRKGDFMINGLYLVRMCN